MIVGHISPDCTARLEQVTAERDQLKARNDELASDVSRMSVNLAGRAQEIVATFHEAKGLRRQLAQLDQANVTLSGQNTDLATANQALREAAQGVLNCIGEDQDGANCHSGGGSCLDVLRKALEP